MSLGISLVWLPIPLLYGIKISYLASFDSVATFGTLTEWVVWLLFVQCLLQIITILLSKPIFSKQPLWTIFLGVNIAGWIILILFIVVTSQSIGLLNKAIEVEERLEGEDEVYRALNIFEFKWKISIFVFFIFFDAAVTLTYGLFFLAARKEANSELREKLSSYD